MPVLQITDENWSDNNIMDLQYDFLTDDIKNSLKPSFIGMDPWIWHTF